MNVIPNLVRWFNSEIHMYLAEFAVVIYILFIVSTVIEVYNLILKKKSFVVVILSKSTIIMIMLVAIFGLLQFTYYKPFSLEVSDDYFVAEEISVAYYLNEGYKIDYNIDDYEVIERVLEYINELTLYRSNRTMNSYTVESDMLRVDITLIGKDKELHRLHFVLNHDGSKSFFYESITRVYARIDDSMKIYSDLYELLDITRHIE